MGKVGHFGDLKWYSKTDSSGNPKVMSFTEMTWDSSVNMAEHKRYHKKPMLEFTTRNADEVHMTMYFMASMGVKPWKMMKKVREYCLNAKVYPLFLGGRRMGKFKFVITNVSNKMLTLHKNGRPLGVACTVTFKEYSYNKKKRNKSR